MDFFDLLTMIGGLALFLFGMHELSDGLVKVSGGRLEKILESLTSTTMRGILLGTGVTAIIQSSSATTVMVVGFVNSGVMNLKQAVGIIIGANVGATITPWILSLTCLNGSGNFFLQMLNPSSFSPILGIIGVAMVLFSKKPRRQDVGIILAGFAVLMTGMEIMSSAVEGLQDMPQFSSIFMRFSNPILGLLVGVILTAIIQSSAASIGILQALSVTGAVTWGAAIPIIMGQNIGTCVTALLSAIGSKKDAVRAAMIHLIYNITKAILFLAGFYIINAFVHFNFLNDSINAVQIAMIHTLCNIIIAAVWYPFSNYLIKIVYFLIPDKPENTEEEEAEDTLQLLDTRFLARPALAIEQSKRVSNELANKAVQAFRLSVSLLDDYSTEKQEKVIELEESVDTYEDALGSYLVKVGSANLTAQDSHSCSILLECMSDFERISDHAINIACAAGEAQEKNLEFSEKAMEEIRILTTATEEITDMALEVFATEDRERAKDIEPLEEVIGFLQAELRNRHVKRLRKGKCTIELGFVLNDIVTNCERVADHCSNVAVGIIQIMNDGYEVHGYLADVKSEENKDFQQDYKYYMKKYKLP